MLAGIHIHVKINFIKIMYYFAVTAGKTVLGMYSSVWGFLRKENCLC